MEITNILMLAVTVEALVEYGKTIGRALIDGWYKAVLQMAAVAVGVVLCLAAGLDLYAALGLGFTYPWIGSVLTGILLSRGANYVSDFVGRLSPKKEVK